MKAARELVQAGRVSSASYEPPLLQGEVREGQKRYRSGLRIRSALDLENICTCRESREWGKVCAHSLAVGLAYLTPVAAVEPAVSRESAAPMNERFVSLGEPGARPLALHRDSAAEFPLGLGERDDHGLSRSGTRRASGHARRASARGALWLRRVRPGRTQFVRRGGRGSEHAFGRGLSALVAGSARASARGLWQVDHGARARRSLSASGDFARRWRRF